MSKLSPSCFSATKDKHVLRGQNSAAQHFLCQWVRQPLRAERGLWEEENYPNCRPFLKQAEEPSASARGLLNATPKSPGGPQNFHTPSLEREAAFLLHPYLPMTFLFGYWQTNTAVVRLLNTPHPIPIPAHGSLSALLWLNTQSYRLLKPTVLTGIGYPGSQVKALHISFPSENL